MLTERSEKGEVMDKKMKLRNGMAVGLALAMSLSSVPYNVFADQAKSRSAIERTVTRVAGEQTGQADALSSATYYNKANWENKIKDKSRWPVGDKQRLVRVTTSDPVEMNDIDYDGNFVDANGRTVLRMVYKEKGAAATGVWYRAIFNFGDLDQYIDYDKSYMVGVNITGSEAKRGNLEPFNDRKERIVDLGVLRGDLTNQRKNLPINLVLKEGVTIDTLGKQNYIVQMRLADTKGERIYAYAPRAHPWTTLLIPRQHQFLLKIRSIDYLSRVATNQITLVQQTKNSSCPNLLPIRSNTRMKRILVSSELNTWVKEQVQLQHRQ